MPRPDVSIVQANTAFPEDALIIVYSSLDDLSFRSSMGAIDKQNYNSITGRYELLIKPIKQMVFVGKPGFLELKLNTLNPSAKDVIYYKVEEKPSVFLNQTVPGKLTINSNPAGANISLNGISITNKTPFTGELNPGRTRIQLSKNKYQTFDTIMNVQSSINEVLTINLKPSTLWLNVKSDPSSANVELDGKIIGKTPLSRELDLSDKSKQGERFLKLSYPDYAELNQTIQLFPSKEPLSINVDLIKLEGDYNIESYPIGAEVFIDGEYKGQTPLQGKLKVGSYQVELKMEEYESSSKKQMFVNDEIPANLKENLILKKKPIVNLDDDFEVGGFVSDASGNSYKTVKIGDQVWMAENLKTDRFANGDLIANVQSAEEWEYISSSAWCNYEDLIQNEEVYGKLYNWYAVADSRNVCPVGWHVPTDSEWSVLTDYLGGEEVAGGKMKTSGIQYWEDPNTNSTNESGLSCLPGGYRDTSGGFFSSGFFGYWWSSTESNNFKALLRFLHYSNGLVYPYYFSKHYGFSVRCLWDNSPKSSNDDLPPGDEIDYHETFTIVEQMPEFPGGEEKLFEYLGTNIKYPSMARENGIMGTVYITFVVEGNGEVTEVKKLRGIGGGCDEEAMRVVKAMPSWKPGRQNGKLVRVEYNLPIGFTIREPNPTEQKPKLNWMEKLLGKGL